MLFATCVPAPPFPDVLMNTLSLVCPPSYRTRTKTENMKIKIWNLSFSFTEETWKESKAENEEPGPLRELCSPWDSCVSLCCKMCFCCHQAANCGASWMLCSGKEKKSVETSALSLISSFCLFCWRIVFYLNLWCVNALNGLYRTVCNSCWAVQWMVAGACPLFPAFWQFFPPLLLRQSWVLGHVANVKIRSLKLFEMLECFFRLFV